MPFHIAEDGCRIHHDRFGSAGPLVLQPLAVTAARIRMLLAHDCLDALPAIRLPTLVLPAAGDILLPPEMSAPIAAAIPGARLTCLPGGHFHPAADPAPLVAALQDFLSEVA